MPRPGLNAVWIWVLIPPLLVGLIGLSIYLALPQDSTGRAETPQPAEPVLSAQTAATDTAEPARPELQPASATHRAPTGEPGSFRVEFSVFEDRTRNYSYLSLLQDTFTGRLNTGEGTYGEQRPTVNHDAAVEEVRNWLQAHRLSSHSNQSDAPEPGEHDRPNVIFNHYGNRIYLFTVSVFDQPRSIIDDLEKRVLKLNGVHDFEVSPGVPEFDGERHRINTRALERYQVRINGKLYSAPEDFNEGENLLIHSRAIHSPYPGEREPRYMFFFSLDLHGPDRFGFGDVVRMGFDGDVQTFDTLVERWDHTAEQHERLLSGDPPLMAYRNPDKTPRSMGLQLPDWLDESEFDPVAELEAILADPNPVRWGDEPTASIDYEIRTEADLSRLSGHEIIKLAADPADAALEAAFMAGVERWLDANPQFRVRNVFVRPVRFFADREGGVLKKLRCVIEHAQPLPYARDLAASLKDIPGLPEPWIDQNKAYYDRIKHSADAVAE